MKRLILLSVVLTGLILANCKSDDDDNAVPAVDEAQNTLILSDFSVNVASAIYVDLATKTSNLQDDIIELTANPTDITLAKCQQDWKAAREVWEQSEAHLFGPVATEDIDPRIDTWPVNFVDLDQQLASDNEFTAEYVNSLDAALKGFHPIEYLLFGKEGEKQAKDYTDRELEYLNALSTNLLDLTAQLAGQWLPASSGNYIDEVSNAGKGSNTYKTQREAFEEIVNAMAGICDEVANGKMTEPYEQKNAALEESPFAKNSVIDFTNNIKGVRNVYTGKFKTDGHGLDELVKAHNLSLDNEITTNIDASINALGNITLPYGEAIILQNTQIEAAITAINELQSVLKDKLLPFVQEHSN